MEKELAALRKKLAPLKGDRRIVGALLFGSCARNESRPLSDIDVCIIPAKDVDLETVVKITPMLDADISYFYSLPLHIQQKVLSDGKPVFINDKIAFAKIKTRIVLAFLDFNPMRQRLMKAMLDRGVF